MKVLFVTPGEFSLGEAITAIHSADRLSAAGHQVHFLASAFTASFLKEHPFTLMLDDAADNQACLRECVDDLKPDAVVFADFSMTFFSNGAAPIGDEAWLKSLETLPTEIFTFDHLGYSQGEMTMSYGPPDRGILERIVQPPERVHVLLPCPVMSPDAVEGRKGIPFKYWQAPQIDEETKGGGSQEVRRGTISCCFTPSRPGPTSGRNTSATPTTLTSPRSSLTTSRADRSR